jgi:molybdate transport system substrate-binding protein
VLYLFGAIALLTLALGFMATFKTGLAEQKPETLLVHGAASLKPVITAIAADYERETGTRVELSFGGSQTLLASISITKRGDLFLPADDSYLAIARTNHLIARVWPVAEQTAVLVVPHGNPKGIVSLESIRDSKLTLSQANPDAAAIGKLVREATTASGLWTMLSNHTIVFKPTVTDAANDVKLGAVDAAIVWDSMQQQYPDMEFIRAPELAHIKATVAVAVLNCSADSAAAQKLAHYIAEPDKGLRQFQAHGFRITTTPR